jgi:hypothetical protein
LLIFDAFGGPKAFFSDRRAQKSGFKNVSSHKPFFEYDKTVLGYQKLKQSVRGLLYREYIEKSLISHFGDVTVCVILRQNVPCGQKII